MVRRFELACWLAAAVLALALMLAPASGSPAHVITTAAPPPVPQLLLYRQHCIERILVHAADKSEEAVVNQINLECRRPESNQPSSAAGSTPLSCGRAFTVRLAPVARRVAGCLGG